MLNLLLTWLVPTGVSLWLCIRKKRLWLGLALVAIAMSAPPIAYEFGGLSAEDSGAFAAMITGLAWMLGALVAVPIAVLMVAAAVKPRRVS